MTYIDSPIEEIKQRLNVVDIIREYVPNLIQVGANWKARCPFHNEKTPSFMVSEEKQIWHCFGCQKGGDVFAFVKEIEGVEFPEVLRILAQKAGIVLKRQNPQLISVKTRLLDLMEAAVNFFEANLYQAGGRQALEYLRARGLTDETLKAWRLGWAPDAWEELSQYLRGQGFADSQILNSGLVVRKPDGRYYDRFRGRIMFPLVDASGNVIGFTGRVLIETDKSGGKYVNTPQTMIYDKSRLVFALNRAKQEIRKNNLAVIVEGQMDAIASHQAGVRHVVASSGTALTKHQLEILSRYAKNLAFCFDADSAGEEATKRGIDLALLAGFEVKIIQVKGAKDPDELIKSQGVGIWQAAIKAAKPIMEYFFELAFSNQDISLVANKRRIGSFLLAQIVKISDRIEQDYWIKELASRLNVDELALRESVKKAEKKLTTRLTADKTAGQPKNREARNRNEVIAERVLAASLKFPETTNLWLNDLEVDIFLADKLKELAKKIKVYYNDNIPLIGGNQRDFHLFNYEEFRASLPEDLRFHSEFLLLLAEKEFEAVEREQVQEEVRRFIFQLKKEWIVNGLKALEQTLRAAEASKDIPEVERLSQKFNQLLIDLKGFSQS